VAKKQDVSYPLLISPHNPTPMTWIMGVILLVYMLERAYRIFVPKGQQLSIAQWKTLAHTDEMRPIKHVAEWHLFSCPWRRVSFWPASIAICVVCERHWH
jgi:hypothetical protein